MFSASPFPGCTHKIVWRQKGQYNGGWYWCEQLNAGGWLCPAMGKFFAEPPKEIHLQALPRNQ
ncbi:MAG: hypothetical protein HZA50_13705 [Planctomycetes bacterium]|nr:hypothetical protein [Planctomycetota bacterium]